MEHEGNGCTNCNWFSRNDPKRLEEFEIGDHPNYSIVEVGHNTKKSPEDLRRLIVSQIPMKDHQLKLV